MIPDLNTYIRPELQRFVVAMEDEMQANDHKGRDGWKHKDENQLFTWLLDEVRELHEALTKKRTLREIGHLSDDVMGEAADVGNIASFIFYIMRDNNERTSDDEAKE